MLAKRIIPCLDVKDGRVVKGFQFESLVDAGDPVQQAAFYDAAGADELCFLDITASHEKRGTMLDIVARCADQLSIPLTVGGGVRALTDARALLAAGADKIAINTAAIDTPALVDELANAFGNQAIVVAVDARLRSEEVQTKSWQVWSHGGRQARGLDVVQWCLELQSRGAGEILLTSMDRDGTRQGYDLELLHAVSSTLSIPVIASGGVGSLPDLASGLQEGGASAVLAASIFHFGQYTVAQAKQFLAAQGIPMRR